MDKIHFDRKRKEVKNMKRVIFVALLTMLVVAITASVALAAGYDAPVSGASPHAGWTTTSDQCKQCHAVHKATGNRLLLRSLDSRYNDCAYCHLDGSGGSGFDVYVGNLNNGHTLGSYVSKTATGGARTSRYDATTGKVIIPDASTASANYRGGSKAISPSTAYTGFDSTGTVSAGVGTGLNTSGDTAFNCNACHQAHANPAKIITWRFQSYNPNARTRDLTGLYTYYGPDYRTAADLNQRTVNTTDLTNKILLKNPNDRTDGAAATYYSYLDADARNSGKRVSSLTQWCADCHNLNVKGPGMVAGNTVNYGTAYTEQANLWSHSTYYNLSGASKFIGFATSQGGSYATTSGGAPACADCHIGYSSATTAHDAGGGDTTARTAGNYGDWPHSGASDSYALLNQLKVRSAPGDSSPSTTPLNNTGTNATTYDAAGLDGTCRTCHGNGAAGNTGRDPGNVIFDNSETQTVFGANSTPLY